MIDKACSLSSVSILRYPIPFPLFYRFWFTESFSLVCFCSAFFTEENRVVRFLVILFFTRSFSHTIVPEYQVLCEKEQH